MYGFSLEKKNNLKSSETNLNIIIWISDWGQLINKNLSNNMCPDVFVLVKYCSAFCEMCTADLWYFTDQN